MGGAGGGFEVDIKKRLSVDATSVTSDDGAATPRRACKAKKFLTAEEQLRGRLWAIYRAVHDYKVSSWMSVCCRWLQLDERVVLLVAVR